MREIAAASDFDFVALEPRRPEKGAARKGAKPKTERSKKAASAPTSRFAALWRYRTPTLGALALSGLLGAVAVNALFLQRGQHPAPLFGATFKIAPPAPPAHPTSLDALLNEDIPQGALKPVDPGQGAAFAASAAGEQAAADHEQRREAERARQDGYVPRTLRSSALIAGTISCRFPITAQSALARIGASGSSLIARILFAPLQPAMCWVAPLIPQAM
ncbi:hypothetical protein [Rhodoblastus sp.]|uniref:hypothetical protein n=1 Tax=Rhodoblastus sp. TaxID=1962975 RepID=UPI003F9B5B75